MAERPEEPESEASEAAATGSDGLAAALAAMLRRRGGGPKPDPKFDAFLDKQARLVDLQTEHLHEQRALILSRLRWGRFSDRIKALLQVLTLLVGLAVVTAVGDMAWQAHEDHGVTIEAFSVPPDFAQRGLTGQVVASRLLGRLVELQSKTVSARPTSSYANDWGDDIKVEIPETGVSIGELNRYLRDWLGSDTRITGDLVRTPAGIAITAQVGASAGRSSEGTDADLPLLIQQVAEAVYGQTQPYRYAVYLASQGKTDQALADYRRLALDGGADAKDRAWAYLGWASLLFERNDPRGALAPATEAIRLDRWLDLSYTIRQNADDELGRPEDDLAAARAELGVLVSGRAEGGTRALRGKSDFVRDALIGPLLGDYGASLATAGRLHSSTLILEGGGNQFTPDGKIEDALLRLHDISGTQRRFASSSLDWTRRARMASELDDWSTALKVIDQQSAQERSWPATQAARAVLLARLGRLAEAGAAIAPTSLDCTDCLVARGEIAARGGDRKGADRWFGEAVKQAPLPDEYLAWGQSLLMLGDPAAAIIALKQAHRVGPHDADPLEVWGEALMATCDDPDAIKKFADADKDAPKWGRNHLRWGEALMLSGRHAEARAQYRAADGMDLSPADRAALNVLLARTASGPLSR